ncbi:7525_t:CDS:2 [Funneliformis caledonium]|uniref:7525_t:CDS:1 n=1 Tax=Funneliformis caledonium TaxID=1117310 RepID=A0A9N9B9N7_9GLOM|nr:7525_t:CDS:2 [Funneliformis caledonium]
MTTQSTIISALNTLEYLNEKLLLNEITEINCDYGGSYDTIIRVGAEPDVKEFRAGSIILCSRSSYFRTALSSEWARKENDVFIIDKPNVRPVVFDIILRYLYIGELMLDNLDADEIYDLFIAADEFMLDDLIDSIPDHVGENMDFWPEQDCIPVLHYIYGVESFYKLRRHLVNKINTNPNWLIDAEDLNTLEETILFSLLRQYNCNLEQTVRWELIIKWGLSQNPSLDGEKLSEWSDDDFKLLGRTVGNLLPLVQFAEISRNDIHSNILPYEKILSSQEMDNSALKWYLTRYSPKGSQGLKDSNLINHVHAAHFIKWIGSLQRQELDGEKQTKTACRYKFDLIFRSSRDGFENFAEKCNQQGPTLAVAKIAGQRCLVGGFDPYGLFTDKKSINVQDGFSVKENFVFFFDNRENVSKSVLCRLNRFDTLYKHFLSEDGPCFGDLRLILRYGSGCYVPSYYAKYSSHMYFNIEECEVFRVVKVDKNSPRRNSYVQPYINDTYDYEKSFIEECKCPHCNKYY